MTVFGRRWLLGGCVALGLGSGGCRSGVPPVPLEQLTAEQAHGHVIYQARCAACHYDRKNEALHGPALVNVFRKASLPSGAAASDERVMATIQHGRNLMPAMGNTMDEAELADLLAYLHTL